MPIRGERAGVDGAESMKVPKDLAVNGGDCILGDIGVIGGEVGGENGDMRDENRCGRMLLGEPGNGSLGMPWLVSGRNFLPLLSLIVGVGAF